MAIDPPSPISSSYQTAANNSFNNNTNNNNNNNNNTNNNNRMHSPNYQRQRTPAAAAAPSTDSLTSNGYRPLNVKDALTYLDQVKVKFSDQPEVYNRFLDIMKEFKSQAIDTPGVIERVSTLFRGHPALISGFNTFLPPGYRIECSTDDHARDIIRVTTPTGTTTTSTTEPMLNLQQQQDSNQADQPRYYQPYPTTPTNTGAYRNTPSGPLPSISSYHPSIHHPPQQPPPPPPHHHHHHHHPSQPPPPPSNTANNNNITSTTTVTATITSSPSPSQPQIAATTVPLQHTYHPSVTSSGPPSQVQPSHIPPPPSANSTTATNNNSSTQSNAHHSAHHHHSSLPSSSTPPSHLPTAPSQNRAMVDESATRRAPVEFNHAINYVNKIKNRFSNDPETYKQFLEILQTYQKEQKPIQEVYAQVQVLFNGANDLLGEFKQFLPDTSSSTTEVPITNNKKKRNISTPLKSSKRSKISKTVVEDDVSDIRSSLLRISPDEQDFFDRVRKSTSHYNTFLKLLSLYSQQILDANTLVDRCEPIIKKQDLLITLKKMVGYKNQDQIIENIPLDHVPDFSKCKEYGPSYRLVPKSWRNQQCSGRDSLCWEVLNDDYISHPNYNDDYICSNKKNQYEEALHRVEDERYEYDINIEANLNTISLLEPVFKKLQNMTEEDKTNFRLPPGLGGPSKTIYQRIIKKVYGKTKANDVIEMLHSHPAQAVPIVLKRLKQKDEEWKKSQREWNKVWREIEIKNYYRSLDYQGVIFKVNDRKKMTVKSLVTEIEALHTDRQRPQFHFEFKDKTLFKDVTRLLFSFFDRQANLDDSELMKAFIEMFLPVLFDVPDVLPTQDNELEESVVEEEEEEEEEEEDEMRSQHSYDSELSSTRRASPRRGRRSPRHNKMMNEEEQPLLKDVLTRSIKNTTPPDEEDMEEEKENDGDDEAEEETQQEVPTTTIKEEEEGKKEEVEEQQKEQKLHRFFGNTAFYCFFRLLQIAYERLGIIKSFDQNNKPNAEKSKELNKTASELNLSSKNLYSVNIDFKSGYYKPMLKLIDRFFDDDVDQHVFEECARYIYGNQAYLMFTIDKLMASITKQLHSIVTEPKAQELLSLYKKNHQHDTNTPELTKAYRQEVSEILNTDDGLYSITFDTLNRILSIQILSYEDEIFEYNNDQQYHDYVTSYTDWEQHTLGVDHKQLSTPFLTRNLKQHTNKHYNSKTHLQYKICKNTYHLFYMMDTEDALIRHNTTTTAQEENKLLFKRDWIDIKDKSKLEKETRALFSA